MRSPEACKSSLWFCPMIYLQVILAILIWVEQSVASCLYTYIITRLVQLGYLRSCRLLSLHHYTKWFWMWLHLLEPAHKVQPRIRCLHSERVICWPRNRAHPFHWPPGRGGLPHSLAQRTESLIWFCLELASHNRGQRVGGNHYQRTIHSLHL